jgi:hypothetical protein
MIDNKPANNWILDQAKVEAEGFGGMTSGIFYP